MTAKGVRRLWYRDKRTGERKQTDTYFITFSAGGKKYREKTGLTSEREAEKLRARRIAEVSEGRFVSAGKLGLDYLEQITRDEYALSGKRSAGRLPEKFARFKSFWPTLTIDRIDAEQVARYATWRREQGAAPATIYVDLAVLKSAMRRAVKFRKLREVPEFPAIEVHNARQVFAERADVDRIQAVAPEWLAFVVELAFVTGWRKEAVLSRNRHEHVDLRGGWLILEPASSKNKQGYRVPLFPAFRERIEEQIKRTEELERKTGRLIPWLCHWDGRQLSRRLEYQWRQALARAGLAHLKFHDLRRGAIRMLRRIGATESEIMQWVGIASPAIFRRYNVIDEVRLVSVGEAYSQAVSSGKVLPFVKSEG